MLRWMHSWTNISYSICQPNQDGRATCRCPDGYSLLNAKNPLFGCRPNYQSKPEDCNEQGSTIGEDRFEFNTMQFVDWPFADYELLQSVNEIECRRSCIVDCICAVAILQPPERNNGTGRCWKKKLQLSNGRFDQAKIDRKVFIKVLKSGESLLSPLNPNPSKKKQNQATLIPSVLLGTSASFNIFTLAMISLFLFHFYQRKLKDLNRIHGKGEIETNLRCFTYKELEDATKGSKEELGKDAFGTVYKGELSRNYVAMKKLEKVIQEWEKEFKTKVSVDILTTETW
ncbi:hypothetical protein SLA2020_105730 [Shorea laevis]